jgi:hypothetical protein
MNDPVLEALWKRVVDGWEDDAAHGMFLEHCQSTDRLLEAAVRYRGMTGDRERGPSAEKRLKGVAILAMASLEASRTSPGEARKNAGRWTLIVVFTAASIALAYCALERF